MPELLLETAQAIFRMGSRYPYATLDAASWDQLSIPNQGYALVMAQAALSVIAAQVLEVVDGASVGDYGYGDEGSGWYPLDPERVQEQIRDELVKLLR